MLDSYDATAARYHKMNRWALRTYDALRPADRRELVLNLMQRAAEDERAANHAAAIRDAGRMIADAIRSLRGGGSA